VTGDHQVIPVPCRSRTAKHALVARRKARRKTKILFSRYRFIVKWVNPSTTRSDRSIDRRKYPENGSELGAVFSRDRRSNFITFVITIRLVSMVFQRDNMFRLNEKKKKTANVDLEKIRTNNLNLKTKIRNPRKYML